MKKLFYTFVIFLILCVAPAMAVNWTWDEHTNTSVIGYNFYWKEAGTTTPVFNKNIPGIDNIVYTVNDLNLKPNVEYDFWVTAYAPTGGESGPSTIEQYTRIVEIYTPPPDNLPTDEYPIVAPGAAQGFRQSI